jgi:hypothetical protein
MHFNEDRISRQLAMKLNVLEKAVDQLINIVSRITLDNQRLQRQIDQLSRNGVDAKEHTTSGDDNYELDINQVQKILKQQSTPQNLGRRIDN